MSSRSEITKIMGEKLNLIVVFFLATFIRSIPEIISYPYPIGFDTITYYIPLSISGIIVDLPYLAPPLIYTLIIALQRLVSDPVIAIKIVGPLLYGVLNVCVYIFARFKLNNSVKDSFITVFISSLHIVNLRVSWDLYKQMLGLTLLLLLLTISSRKGLRWAVLIALIGILNALTHELTTAMMVLLFLSKLIISRSTFFRLALRNFTLILPSIFIFLLGRIVVPTKPLDLSGLSYSINLLDKVFYDVGFFFYVFFLTIPILVIGLFVVKDFELKSWFMLCLLLTFLPTIMQIEIVPSYRWILLLGIPLSIISSQGALWFSRSNFNLGLVTSWFLIIMLSFTGYAYLTYQEPLRYTTIEQTYLKYVPSKMVESTIPLNYIDDLNRLVLWIDEELEPGSIILTPFQFYGWIIYTFSHKSPIRYEKIDSVPSLDILLSSLILPTDKKFIYLPKADVFEPESLNIIYSTINNLNYSNINLYVIWWKPNIANTLKILLPEEFNVVKELGGLAVYAYLKTK